MTDLDAGRALDERVAQLLAWSGDNAHDATIEPLPFSTDVAAAMTLLDTLAERGWCWVLVRDNESAAGLYHATLWSHPTERDHERAAPTLPLAVCRAVEAALGEEGA
jgi:hypothetical protein